ncbi:TIGR02680 family protein [Halobacillus amylolyticus]|uniref:TIGR02680 family protein n=1 Tax=Halobacillus amylolyticus TaxID=2932259 RepID=A0ABY4HFT8_9BACI|nr:TIGR02680 family protein [Halobacillus amylolyticus]UOR13489.1 TIGR02680 family protein [Halobacillus amylolyticus]
MERTNKWMMNRAGLLNFWYYDDETFDFANGKLLLRGSNGSGKSVTMQSFLPVLLDGKKSPDRLDPFGSKARRMEDYLLGEKEVVNRDERTGYLFIEFKREDMDQYITIGIGLQARRQKQMKFWGFVITDNRRIGHELELFKYERNAGEKQKIPRSRIELENIIGEGGHVVQTQREYMSLVNKYIFGFETMEAYEDLIKLLIQLRSPKLSKDFKPTVIYEILEAALPPLSDEDLRHLSDTIEQMDQTKQQIEQLNREQEAIQSLNKSYNQYNQYLLADHANEYQQAVKRVENEQEVYEQAKENQDTLVEDIRRLKAEIQQHEQEEEAYEKQKQRLHSHKVWNLEEEKQEAQTQSQQVKDDVRKKEEKLDEQKKKERAHHQELAELEGTIADQQSEMNDFLNDLEQDAEEASFHSHAMNVEDFSRHEGRTFDFSVWKKEAEQHRNQLEKLEEKFRDYEGLKEAYQGKNREMANEQKKLDEKDQEKREWARLFEEDKEQKLQQIHAWAPQYDWLRVPERAFQDASRTLYRLYEPDAYEAVVAPFKEELHHYAEQRREEVADFRSRMKTLNEKLEDKEAELKEWKEKKDPEPDTHPSTKEARQQLRDKQAAFLPFYSAVEFQEHVSEELRATLESVLIESGMLDALLTDQDLLIKHDRMIRPNPNTMAHTLADYLQPDVDENSVLSAAFIDEVLRSVVIDDKAGEGFSISEDGSYHLGIFEGHAPPVDARFIGRSARKRYREQQIQSISLELEQIHEEINQVNAALNQALEAIEETKRALVAFPSDHDLQEGFKHIQAAQFAIEQHRERVEILSNEVKAVWTRLQEAKRFIDEQSRLFSLEACLDAYSEAKQVMARYQRDLFEFITFHTQHVNDLRRFHDVQERLRELESEVDELRGEVNSLTDKLERIAINIKQIDIQLEQEGAADIREQIREVQQKLADVTKVLGDKSRELPRKEEQWKYDQQKLIDQQSQTEFWTLMSQAWAGSFEAELKLGLVQIDQEEENLAQLSKAVLTSYGHLLKEKVLSQLKDQLTREFYKQQSDLMEYRGREMTIPIQKLDWMNDATEDTQVVQINQWIQKGERRIIEMDFRGQQVTPYYVQSEIEQDQARQESLLDEQDQALYEEILFKSVGNKLRSRIRRAEQWTSKMNRLMESRDTSSGLSFSIHWRPRTADSEEEMDTKDLVQLLKQDAKLLKEEDLNRITTHFRSKIAKAKELIEEKGEGQTLLQMLKEVLDYRKWFSFALSYRRENEPKRELTNNAFYKFSGGEKAMAMYIPLFTACYSRYQEASSSAPYIISLDEAFAGVDENNIKEMFEVVEHLEFDYMMNSQVLWGDYETISALSIYELVRPKNASFVSVIHYKWDGHQLSLNELPAQEESLT